MTLTRAGPADARAVGASLARVFHDDPLLVHMLPDEAGRTALAAEHFERVVRLIIATGEVWRSAGFDAVVCWTAPGRWPATAAEEAQAGIGEIPALVGADAWERFASVYKAMDSIHAALVTEPHWVLQLIGVEPGRRGAGLGARLLRPILERADVDGTHCYLETLNAATLPFYERHGFAVAADRREPVSGLRFWCCVRTPE
jgi:GNAT superfamily N-acetyltransferase